MTKLGVVIAAYNVENEIVRCLNSLHNQVFQDVQFLVINDGSTDQTAEVVNDFIANSEDSRFKLLSKQSKGPSSTRNYGMQHLDTEYLLFVDGDDTISSNPYFLEQLVHQMDQNTLDLIEFNYLEDVDGKERKAFVSRETTRLISGIELFYQSIYNNRFNSYVWHYAYRKSFLEKHAFWFKEEIFNAEDVLFIIPVLIEAQRAMFWNVDGYVYIRRDNTITNNSNINHRKRLVKDHLLVLEMVNNNIQNSKIDHKYMFKIDNLLARAFMVNVVKAKGYHIAISKKQITSFLNDKKLTRSNYLKKQLILNLPNICIKPLSKLLVKIFP